MMALPVHRRAIMQSLQAIHRKHMVHHNITLTEPNIVIDEASSSVRFIGLGRAYHLTCGFRGDINQEFGKNEEISIGCDELQKLGRYMWIWLPGEENSSYWTNRLINCSIRHDEHL